ncbi:MAG: hypothetical protein M1822_002647 [Bathelium mastoideum]|nr:MAG: hypothetical protein M1822_002647 [Bathelium mastoideum]
MSGDLTIIDLPNNANLGENYPLNGVTDEHARQFRKKYKLQVEEDVFIRGVLATRNRAVIEARFRKAIEVSGRQDVSLKLKIGTYTFTDLEVESLKGSWTRGRWETLRHTARLHWLLIVTCNFAAVTQGWDQTAMAGAAIYIMTALGRPITNSAVSAPTSKPDSQIPLGNTWLFGFLVGAPFLFGAPIGLLVTDRLTEIWQFGRRGAICASGIFSFISVVGSASIHTWPQFLAFRILLGVGMAGKASIVPILLSETSPKNVRGILVMCWQLFVALGIALGSIANISVYKLDTRQSWRYMFISAFIPALLLFSLVLFSPESPRWLLKKSGKKVGEKSDEKSDSRVRQALKSLVQLHDQPSPILTCGELYLLHKRLIEEQEYFGIKSPDRSIPADEVALQEEMPEKAPDLRKNRELVQATTDHLSDSNAFTQTAPGYPLVTSIKHVSWRQRWNIMRREGRMRRANYAAGAVMISQQLCGINLLALMADTFFRNSVVRNSTSPDPNENLVLLAFSLGFGACNFLSNILALFFIDSSEGRRRLLNWSFPGMALSLLCSALVLASPENTSRRAKDTVVAFNFIFLLLFTASYSIGEGPAAFVIASEVFPLVNRELGMSLAVFWNFLGAGLLALLSPALTRETGLAALWGLFSGINLLVWFACYVLIPNTGNEELEDVLKRLDVPTRAALIYSLARLWRKICKSMDYAFHFMTCNRKTWEGSGYGPSLEPLEEMIESIRDEKNLTIQQAADCISWTMIWRKFESERMQEDFIDYNKPKHPRAELQPDVEPAIIRRHSYP